ncbi:MAG: HAMP domain-containing protein [Planctomycetaceae bacterium]|jgi:signal transduction histidine kinase|nr:HAMP domain-containing protein [Planctomycetaceae bacterium]
MPQLPNHDKQIFESSLELKCLFFFGVALLVVIIVSFWLYWSATEALIRTQNQTMARSLAKEHLVFEHVRNINSTAEMEFSGGAATTISPNSPNSLTLPNPSAFREPTLRMGNDNPVQNDFRKAITELLGEDSGRNQRTRVIRSPNFSLQIPQKNQPRDEYEEQLVERFRVSPDAEIAENDSTLINQDDIKRLQAEGLTNLDPSATLPDIKPVAPFADMLPESEMKPPVFVQQLDSEGSYHYYEPRWAQPSCLICHRDKSPRMELGDLIGIIEVTISDPPSKKVATEYWVKLLVASIVTATLAMLAFYLIIRLIIIRPLRHLRNVSDAISHGDVSQRADLHTGDEFESLALAFNRTVRHILNAQEKLRGTNAELDQRIDQLARINVQLYESNRIKSDFMATMSHELRTPLNSIIGFSDVLASINSLDDKQKRYVGNISKSGKLLLNMINDILDMAKIESGRIEIQLSTFPVASIVAAQCDMAKPLGDHKNIDILCDLSPNLPPLHQDASRLQQILNNLLSNAIKFTPEGGRIKVQVRRVSAVAAHAETQNPTNSFHRRLPESPQPFSNDEPMLEMKVIDTGVGISDEDKRIIFEKFRQGKNSMTEGDAMKREYSGSGLGLSIVKELCRLLDGNISVESRLGLGSTFTVLLPWRLKPKTRIESEILAEIQEFSQTKPGTKRHLRDRTNG